MAQIKAIGRTVERMVGTKIAEWCPYPDGTPDALTDQIRSEMYESFTNALVKSLPGLFDGMETGTLAYVKARRKLEDAQ